MEITDSLLVKDLRKALPRRDPRSRPLDLLLAPDAIPVAPDVSGAKVGLREARRALRFDTELRIAVLLIAEHSEWVVRIYREGNSRFADLACAHGGIRRWRNVAATIQFVKRNFPRVTKISVVIGD